MYAVSPAKQKCACVRGGGGRYAQAASSGEALLKALHPLTCDKAIPIAREVQRSMNRGAAYLIAYFGSFTYLVMISGMVSYMYQFN